MTIILELSDALDSFLARKAEETHAVSKEAIVRDLLQQEYEKEQDKQAAWDELNAELVEAMNTPENEMVEAGAYFDDLLGRMAAKVEAQAKV